MPLARFNMAGLSGWLIPSLGYLVLITSIFASPRLLGEETLPALGAQGAPNSITESWRDFDPRADPLDIEVLARWQESGIQLKVVRFRIGTFAGQPAFLAGVYGAPLRNDFQDKTTKIPGLVQIHGGGQYADYQACLANGKRGYATLSIAWAGRISAPGYRVGPNEVRLFWEQKTNHPNFRLTTDWGRLDAYHAPSRNPGNAFVSVRPAEWTIDKIESPRNSGWFLCALAARRALTFLEQQPEVDPQRLGVYGHSMGGKLTVLASVDPRVKAAAPSCGGISDRVNTSEIYQNTIADQNSLRLIRCPILFLSPSNDFHGRIGDLPKAIDEIQAKQWRVTCSPHHNHQDTEEYEVATMLWFDQHLKHRFRFPETPKTSLKINPETHAATIVVSPDDALPIVSVDVFATQQGKENESPNDRLETMHRFWHHCTPTKTAHGWETELPISTLDAPMWYYANVVYELEEPVNGVGYYYRAYKTTRFNLSSILTTLAPSRLQQDNLKVTLRPSQIIEDFDADWRKEWFSYRPHDGWQISTNKLNSKLWKPLAESKLSLTLATAKANVLIVKLDDFVTECELEGNNKTQTLQFELADFHNAEGQSLSKWGAIRQMTLAPSVTLRPGRNQTARSQSFGKVWEGPPPQFKKLEWTR